MIFIRLYFTDSSQNCDRVLIGRAYRLMEWMDRAERGVLIRDDKSESSYRFERG